MQVFIGVLIFFGAILAMWLIFGGGDLITEIIREFANSKLKDAELNRDAKRLDLMTKEAQLKAALKEMEK